MLNKKLLIPFGILVLLAVSRLIPHPPNFTPIIAVAVMSSYFFKNKYISLTVLFLSMFLSDVFIGFYQNMYVVYLSLLLIVYFFSITKNKITSKNLFIFCFFGSLIFFFVSNFGVWAFSEMYEKNFNGLIYCYFSAIPFFTNTFLSTIFFSYVALFSCNVCYKKFA